MDINEKMNIAVENDDLNKIENLTSNANNFYMKCSNFNIWNGTISYEWRWVDISNVHKDYYMDLNGDAQEYVGQLKEYKDLDIDAMEEAHDNKAEAYQKKHYGMELNNNNWRLNMFIKEKNIHEF